MRILQLAPLWETVPPPAYGGTETVVSVLTEELVRAGHDVVLAAALVVGLAAGLAACFLDASVALADLLAGAGAAVCFFGWGSVAAVRWPPSAIRDAKANARVAAIWFLGIVILFPLAAAAHASAPAGPPLRRDSCGRFVPPSPFTKP